MRRQANVAAVAGVSAGVYVTAAAGVLLIMHLMNKQSSLNGIGGFGKSFKRAVRKVSSPVRKVAAPVRQITAPARQVLRPVTSAPLKAAGSVGLVARGGVQKLTSTAGAAVAVPIGLARRPKKPGEVAPDGTVVTQYQDADGRPITEAQYNALVAGNDAAASSSNTPVIATGVEPRGGQPTQPDPTGVEPRGGQQAPPLTYGGSGADARISSQDVPSSAGSGTTVEAPTTSTPSVQPERYAPAPAAAKGGGFMKVGALLLIPLAIGFMNKDH